MVLDRLFGDSQTDADLPVAHSEGDVPQHLQLAVCENWADRQRDHPMTLQIISTRGAPGFRSLRGAVVRVVRHVWLLSGTV